jgi:transposase-like protein
VDPRFDLPLYTRAEVALQLGLPPTTLGDWLRSGALEAGSGGRGEPTITFAGLVETHMLRQLRHAGLSLQAIGEAAVALRSRAGRRYPLAWSGLAHDDHVRTGSSYREIATKFGLEDYEVEALVRPHIRPPAIRKARHATARAQPLL